VLQLLYAWGGAFESAPLAHLRARMRNHLTCLMFAAFFAVSSNAFCEGVKGSPDSQGQEWDIVQHYCTDCHNTIDWAGGVAFDTMTPDSVAADGKVWEAAVQKLRVHLMPPPDKRQPSQAQLDELSGWLKTKLDHSQSTPRAAYVPVQRLNRTEYGNAVRTLLGVEINAKDLLPPEIEVGGFDKVAAALNVSPAFMDQYISAARYVAGIAVGSVKPKLSSSHYPPPTGLDGFQESYVDGMPPGSRGGMRFRHNFPADGEYRITIKDLDIGLYPRAAETRSTLVILLDDHQVFRHDVGGREDLALVDQRGADGRAELIKRFTNIPAQVKAGDHQVVITFIERARAESDEAVGGGAAGFGGVFSGLRIPRLLEGVDVSGPYGETSLSDTPSRKKIFVCHPASPAEETACAQRIAENLARRAFRRPVDQKDVERLMPFYQAGRKEGSFDSGVKQLVAAVLSSPEFLYRTVVPPKDVADSQAYPLSDVELASRLSFFLWCDIPDDQLLGLAAAGKLHERAVLGAQVRRMLADPRAGSLVTSFAIKWLDLDKLDSVVPDPRLFPAFTPALRQEFAQEAELFLRSVLLDDQNVVRLLDANYTYLNEHLARHYGIRGVRGPQFRRIELTDEARYGLLGKGAVLMRTSYGDRTSPVLRGAWVLGKLLGTAPTPPPPGVVIDLGIHPGKKPNSLRERLELHRTDSSCAHCHGVIDPLGVAMENYDVTGQWRTVDHEAQLPIDANVTLPDHVPVTGVSGLRADILKHPELFVQAMTEKLMMYALGRELDYSDYPQARAIVAAAAKNDYRFSSLVLGVAESDAFRMQSEPRAKKPVDTKVAAAH
jgi:hypothetical protein